MSSNSFDLLFVGSGASSSYTLKHFVEVAMSSGLHARIGVVEKSGEFFTGIAYGQRSGSDALTITTLKDFLPPDELKNYLDWSEKTGIKNSLQPASQKIRDFQRDTPSAQSSDEAELHLESICTSRKHYGNYLANTVSEVCQSAARKGLISVEKITGEVIDIRLNENAKFNCELVSRSGGHSELISKEVVIAIGSGSVREITGRESPTKEAEKKLSVHDNKPPALYLRPYEHDFDAALSTVFADTKLQEKNHNGRVLLIGANASALEVAFHFWMNWKSDGLAFNIDLVSTAGVLPEVYVPAPNDESIESLLLDDKQLESLSAEALHAASEDLLKKGKSKGLPIAAYMHLVNDQIFRSIKLMPRTEAIRFLREFAVPLGKYQRKAESLYLKAANQLIDAEMMVVRSGSVHLHEKTLESGMVDIVSTNGQSHPEQYDYIINCMGFEPVNTESSTPLIRNLLKRGMTESATMQSGFIVDDNFKTPSGLHIMGPLLSGNFIQGKPVWHMEHVGRIYEFSKGLADVLSKRIAAG